MFNFSQTLTQLQEQVLQVKSNDSLCLLSVYLPFNQQSQSSSITHLTSSLFKSLVENAIQEHFPLPEQKRLRLEIIDEICAISGSFDMTQKGVCVYASFHQGSEYRGNNQKTSDSNLVPFIQIVPLFVLPDEKSSAFVGKVFDLIPLIENLNLDKQKLIIDIHSDEALFYEFAQMRLKLLANVENSYAKFPEREEYLDQSQGNHSNRKDFNYEEDYLHQFIRDDLTTAVNKYADQYEELVVVFPEEYQSQVGQFGGMLKKDFSDIQLLHLVTNKTQELLFKHLSEEINKQIEESKQSTIKQLQDPQKKLSTNVQAILEASKNGQIETLYVIPDYHTPGFVNYKEDEKLEKGDEKIVNTNQNVFNIIQNVIEFGGKVISIPSDLTDDKSNKVFAVFRY